MRISIVFDTEDYITPPDVGLDDLVKMLADTMTKEKITGTFFVIGEKMRCLRDRGRQDVLASLRCHDIGSHTDMGSIHPTVTERMEHADWSDGVARMLADEVGGIIEMGEILGAPLRSFARHGGSYSPQLVAALGRMSLPFCYSPAELPNHNITWYGNTINFAMSGLALAFQDDYSSTKAFSAREAQFQTSLKDRKNEDWLGIFHSHPCKIKMSTFGCTNYYKGIFTPPEKWEIPQIRPDYSQEAVEANWALHCRHLREDPNVNVMSISQVADEFRQQVATATTREIETLARMAADIKAPFWTDRFSAAEIVDLLARAILYRSQHGKLPTSLPRRDVLGPSQMPLANPTARYLMPDAVKRVARGIDTAISFSGIAPSRIRCAEGTLGSMGEVGLGTALVALGEALLAKDLQAAVTTRPVAPYLPEGEGIAMRVRDCKNWNPHRLDLDMADIARHSALQSWTLKPAWAGAPPPLP